VTLEYCIFCFFFVLF